MKFDILLLLVLISGKVLCLKYCSHGDMDTIRAPYVEDCSTGKLQLTDTISLHRTARSSDENLLNSEQNDTSTTLKQYCYIFTHYSNQNLSSDDHTFLISTQINANFSCDHSSICQKNGIFSNVKFNGREGRLFCCSNSDQCNNPLKKPIPLPLNQLMCYNGTNNHDSKLISCKDPKDYCAVSTLYSGDNITHVHYCDQQRCQKNHITNFVSSYQKCKNITQDGITEELCCCVHSKCNKPHILPRVTKNTEEGNSPDYTHVKILVICIVVGVVVTLFFIFVVYSLIKRHFKKLKTIRDNARAVRMSYKEINADEVSNSETAHILYL